MKNTHLHNVFTFSICEPSKLVSLQGAPSSTGRAIEAQEKMKAAKLAYLSKQADTLIKGANNADFKELHKLDADVAGRLVWRLRSSMLNSNNSKQLSSNLKFMFNSPTAGKTLSQKTLYVLKRIREDVLKAKKAIKERAAAIKKNRTDKLNKEIGKTEQVKAKAAGVVKSVLKSELMGKELSKEVEAAIVSYGVDLYIPEVLGAKKALLYTSDAWRRNANGVISFDWKHKIILKASAAWEDPVKFMIQRELLNSAVDTQKDKKGKGLETFYVGGGANVENKESQATTVKWLKEKVFGKMRPGSTLFVNITSHTSPEGSASVNKALRLRRFEAKKRMFYSLIAKELGPNWRKAKGNVDFRMVEKEIAPKVDNSDIPASMKKAFNNKNNPKFAEWRKLLKVKTISEAIKKINNMSGNAESRLLTIIRLLGNDTHRPKQVLSEYNTYISIRVRQGVSKAENWLRKNSKYLVKLPHLLKYLNKSVGRARSTVAEVVQGNPWALAARQQLLDVSDGFKGYRIDTSQYAITDRIPTTGVPINIVNPIFKMETREGYKPPVQFSINANTSIVNIKIGKGRTMSLSAKTPNLLAKVEGLIERRLTQIERKLDRGFDKIQKNLHATGKYNVEYKQVPYYDESPFATEMKVMDKKNPSKLVAEVYPEGNAGNKFKFEIAGPPKKEENVAVAQVSRRKIDQMFA